MKNYNELLTSMSSQLSSFSKTRQIKEAQNLTSVRKDSTSIMLNKIELEVQRQGGY